MPTNERYAHILWDDTIFDQTSGEKLSTPELRDCLNAQAKRIEELEAALEEIEYEDDCVACQEKARAALKGGSNE
jgi:hypothetical protein